MDFFWQSFSHNIQRFWRYKNLIYALALYGVYSLCPGKISKTARKFIPAVPILFGIALLFTAGLYLFFPTFQDHLEATIKVHGDILRMGESLYPAPPGYYPYHGMLYGPIAAYAQFAFGFFGLPPILGAKLPGILFFTLFLLVFFKTNKSSLSRAYILFLIPFLPLPFWNRPEPFLLLFTTLACLLAGLKEKKSWLPFLIGVLGGLASATKPQAAVYVFAAYLAAQPDHRLTVKEILIIALGWAAAFFICFLPSEVSLVSYIHYLRLAGKHGLTSVYLVEMSIFSVLCLIPVVPLLFGKRFKPCEKVNLLLILAAQILIFIVACKPGAGVHHLIPFVPVYAALAGYYYAEKGYGQVELKIIGLFFISVALTSYSSLRHYDKNMLKTYGKWQVIADEVGTFAKKYPGLVMLPSDDYLDKRLTLRAILAPSPHRLDHSAFLDLQFAGVDDAQFAQNLENCAAPYYILPLEGEPISLLNPYTAKPLFSDATRKAFQENCTLIQSGDHYRIFVCPKGLPNHY